jgi:hypothetical protein
MAEINIAPLLETGLTNVVAVYTRLSDGAFWNTSGTPAYEAYNAANIANYATAATEIGATGQYKATNPSPTTPGTVQFVTKAGASLAVSDIVSNVRYVADAGTEIAAAVATAILTTQMTESYRAAGAAPTLAQAQFEMIAHMGDMAISGTTKTIKKIDGTTAKTFTLDSSTAPTSISEST